MTMDVEIICSLSDIPIGDLINILCTLQMFCSHLNTKIEQQNRINTNVINDHNNTLLQFHSVL